MDQDTTGFTADYAVWAPRAAAVVSMYGDAATDLSHRVSHKHSYALNPVILHNGRVVVMMSKRFDTLDQALSYIDEQDVLYTFVFVNGRYVVRSGMEEPQPGVNV